MSDFTPFREKMTAAGLGEAAIGAFERGYQLLASGEKGLLGEESIHPADSVPNYLSVASEHPEWQPELLAKTVVLKLNGGLGTGMGLQKAKSLLEVKDGETFLDLIAQQIAHLREETGAHVRFLLMNSFSTSEDTLAALQGGPLEGEEVEMLQNKVPKIEAATLAPVAWPADPDHEWCPPGHGDLYPALVGSGWLDRLLADGIEYAFVSNSDNLGATLDAGLLSWFAESGAPFAMEVTRRTEADKKGGHLAVRKDDDRLVLREVAQCPEADLDFFQDISRHQYFNTNNLWLHLPALKEALEAANGVLPLPVIQNAKTVDPRDKDSTRVYQLETAMGAAIECFEGALAVEVPRSRFAPVKTTSDLFALRSDAYEKRPDGSVGLVPARAGKPPVVKLSSEYKLVDSLTQLGQVPSLVEANSLTVEGPVAFAPGVIITGDASFTNCGEIPAGRHGA
ncbi:UTP--glucose-1-phosphate uridylyltransferase [Roseibacillus ishigakijimensis]|uniref:UTP--glucose-1-phosphate uridylyltransferase n=1 Tax=Roseibacillus ishigakijimensis TaxID=454146 RepID=A0A934RQT7_9BACT|nr:UTP--glucose-1-phosphate uridylyltransferase [Roseibacillus ishigakijimensis]MBK1833758.1 UTP--glucose-1-phosphate uridylyltransferase [Roseibacillus ishigakijimensis]